MVCAQMSLHLHLDSDNVTLCHLTKPKLTSATLSGCVCNFLQPICLDYVPCLKHLVINNSNLSDISFIVHFPYLETLDLSNNDISLIDWTVFANHKFLRTLQVSHNKINVLLNKCDLSLLSIDLSHNYLQSVGSLSSFSRLKHVDLSFNYLFSFPSFPSHLPRLLTLNLSNNPLSHACDTSLAVISNCKYLLSLDLAHTHLKHSLSNAILFLPTLLEFNGKSLSEKEKLHLLSFLKSEDPYFSQFV
ncbi:hypothetical protein GEMRC1_003130 [Eukaryota sp. GEM-RC1]